MQLSPELNEKLEKLSEEFSMNLRSDGVPETVCGLVEYMLSQGSGAIPIATTLITNGLALMLTVSKGDPATAIELFDIVANRAKQEIPA